MAAARALRTVHSAQGLLARWLLAGLLAVGPSAPAWGFGFSVEPARIQLKVPPGKRRGSTLTVRNAREEPIHLTAYVRDITPLPDGTHEFPLPGSTAWSCAEWVRVVPEELEIPPKSTQEVRVSVAAPPEASGGRYAIIFFETGPSYAEQGIGVNFRVGALVEAVIPGTEQPAASLQDLAFVPPAEVRMAIQSDGNLLVRPTGRIKIFDAEGKKVRDLAFNPGLLGILPRTLRQFSTSVEDPLPAGSYRLKAEVDYGARTLLVGELSFQVH